MEMYHDPRFRALTASQRSALQLLPTLMAEFGRDGILRWTHKEICCAVQLGPKLYAALLEMLTRHEWGGETEEGWLVLSLPSAAAERAAIIEEARPGIIREYEAERKQKSRTPVSGTCPGNVPEMSRTSESSVPAYIDTPAHAFDRSIDIEDNILSNSNDRSIEPPTPIPEPRPALTMVPADLAQSLVRYGISARRAGIILEEEQRENLDHVKLVLTCIPHMKTEKGKEGRLIEYLISHPEKLKIPPQVAQGTLPLLTGQQGGAPPRSETKPPPVSLKALRESLTDAECNLLRCEAVDRLNPVERREYDKAIGLQREPSLIVRDSITAIENNLLRAGRKKAATG